LLPVRTRTPGAPLLASHQDDGCCRIDVWRASHGGTLRMRALIGSLVLGALLMASPIVLLKMKNLRYFRQDR